MPFLPKGWELIIILVVILIIFGPKNLPKLGSAIGRTVKNLREGMDGDKDKAGEDESEADAEVEDVADDVVADIDEGETVGAPDKS